MTGIVIVGAGPGIATSVARRFAAEGMPVGLVARTEASIGATRNALLILTSLGIAGLATRWPAP